MGKRPTYEELRQRIKEFEKQAGKRNQAEEALLESEEKYRLGARRRKEATSGWLQPPIKVWTRYLRPASFVKTYCIASAPLLLNRRP